MIPVAPASDDLVRRTETREYDKHGHKRKNAPAEPTKQVLTKANESDWATKQPWDVCHNTPYEAGKHRARKHGKLDYNRYSAARVLRYCFMHPDTRLVSQLQAIDLRMAELEKEVAALPKHIAVIEKTLESHQRRLEADRAALTANQKDRKKFEGDVQMNEQKISKLRDQMLGAKTNEQYQRLSARNRVCCRTKFAHPRTAFWN